MLIHCMLNPTFIIPLHNTFILAPEELERFPELLGDVHNSDVVTQYRFVYELSYFRRYVGKEGRLRLFSRGPLSYPLGERCCKREILRIIFVFMF